MAIGESPEGIRNRAEDKQAHGPRDIKSPSCKAKMDTRIDPFRQALKIMGESPGVYPPPHQIQGPLLPSPPLMSVAWGCPRGKGTGRNGWDPRDPPLSRRRMWDCRLLTKTNTCRCAKSPLEVPTIDIKADVWELR